MGKFTITIILLLLATGCTGQEVMKIGWIGPQTGQSAVLGIDSVVAAQMAVDEINAQGGINGKQVQLLVEDDQYDVAKSISAYQKLVQVDNVDIVLMHTYGAVFALADQAAGDGVIILDPLDCNSMLADLGDHVFCLATDSESIATVLIQEVKAEGAQKVGILHWNSDTFMPLVKDVFVREFEGETIVEAYSAGTKDFKTSLLKMQDVDALVLLGYDETGIAMKQARDLGYTGKFYTSGTVTSPGAQEAAQGNAEGTILAFWEAPSNENFEEEFQKRQGRPPILDLATYPTYDAIHALAIALENPAGVQKGLLAIDDFTGITGIVRFADDGSMRIPENAFILSNGVPVPLS